MINSAELFAWGGEMKDELLGIVVKREPVPMPQEQVIIQLPLDKAKQLHKELHGLTFVQHTHPAVWSVWKQLKSITK
jgi:hypothetical protein